MPQEAGPTICKAGRKKGALNLILYHHVSTSFLIEVVIHLVLPESETKNVLWLLTVLTVQYTIDTHSHEDMFCKENTSFDMFGVFLFETKQHIML